MPKDIPLEQAHREGQMLEQIFNDHFENYSEILIYLDPCLDTYCKVYEIDPCDIRKWRQTGSVQWNRPNLIVENSLEKF
jgi:hypothetical protein